MQAGVLYGYVGQTEYIIRRIKEESGLDNIKVVATGGLGKLISGIPIVLIIMMQTSH